MTGDWQGLQDSQDLQDRQDSPNLQIEPDSRVILGIENWNFRDSGSHFGTILAPFWHLGPPFWRAWGIQGHPTGQQGVPGEIFIDLGWIWGPNWTPIW